MIGLLLAAVISSASATSLPPVSKQVGDYVRDGSSPGYETTVLADPGINSGKPFTVTLIRPNAYSTWPPPAGLPQIVVRDMATQAVLKSAVWTGGGYLLRAQIISGVVNIFGTRDPANSAGQNAFVRSTLDSGFNPSTPQVIWPGIPGVQAMLGGVTQDGDGKFSLYYSNQYGYGFLVYPDSTFASFANVPTGQGLVSGGPYFQNAQWFGGYWYALTLSYVGGNWVSGFTRSSDRTHWTASSKTFLTPSDMPSIEGTNNSDVTWLEYGGSVIGTYLDGDQSTWSSVRLFSYPKPLARFYAEFFP